MNVLRPGSVAAARLAWSLGAASVAASGAGVALARAAGGAVTDQLAFMLPFVAFVPVAALVAARRPANPIGWLLLGSSLAIALYALLQQYGLRAFGSDAGVLPGGALVSWVRVSLWVPTAVTVLVLLPLLFPTGRPVAPRWGRVGRVATLGGVLHVLVVQVAAWPHRGPALLVPDEAWMVGTAAELVTTASFAVLVGCGVLAWASLVVRFRRGGALERQQLGLVLLACGVFIVGLVGPAPYGETTVALVPVAIGVAILRHRLWDIDRIVSRTVGYLALSAVLGACYVAVVLAGQAVVGPGDPPDLVVALATLVVAGLVRPLRSAIQQRVDRRFDRSAYRASEVMEAFASHVRDQVVLDRLADDLQGAVSAALAPATLSVWLRPRPGSTHGAA